MSDECFSQVPFCDGFIKMRLVGSESQITTFPEKTKESGALNKISKREIKLHDSWIKVNIEVLI